MAPGPILHLTSVGILTFDLQESIAKQEEMDQRMPIPKTQTLSETNCEPLKDFLVPVPLHTRLWPPLYPKWPLQFDR